MDQSPSNQPLSPAEQSAADAIDGIASDLRGAAIHRLGFGAAGLFVGLVFVVLGISTGLWLSVLGFVLMLSSALYAAKDYEMSLRLMRSWAGRHVHHYATSRPHRTDGFPGRRFPR